MLLKYFAILCATSMALVLSLSQRLEAQEAPSSRSLPGVSLQLAPGVELPASPGAIAHRKLSPDLQTLHGEFQAHQQSGSGAGFQPSNAALPVVDDWVAIDTAASDDPLALQADLTALGMINAAINGRMVSGMFPIAALDSLPGLGSLQLARPAYVTNDSGLTTSQGDVVSSADDARTTFAVDGSGVVVGTLSDSYDCLGGAAADVSNDDLPTGVNLLAEQSPCSGTDEGRAMMQLIHDLAPGASLAYHTAMGGQANFANGIADLANLAGAHVIVDDLRYFAEPMFQDGIIAQAVDGVVGAGVAYFSSAGNYGRDSYESAFRGSSVVLNVSGTFYGELHDFQAGAGVDLWQRIELPVGDTMNLILQWDSPFFSVSGPPGSGNDLNVFILDELASTVLMASSASNVGGDPLEILSFTNDGSFATTTFNVAITLFAGADPGLLKYVIIGDGSIQEFDTASSTIYGHANAAGAVAVGAAAYYETPAFGVTPPLLEAFSSAGRTPILFDLAGNPVNISRQKPEITCVDGTNNTFFGSDIETDGFPNFFGTSAAAPHAAAIAALMLDLDSSLTPTALLGFLESTAVDMGTVGVDDDSGHGLCEAELALTAVSSARCPALVDLPAGPWQMVGLGCDMAAGDTVADVFGAALNPADYADRWGVFEHDAATNNYRQLLIGDSLNPNRGYWVRTLDGASVNVGGMANGPRDLALTGVAGGRMNLIGNFYPNPICWEDSQVLNGASLLTLAAADPLGDCHTPSPSGSCVVSATAWRYNGAAYETFNGLVPGTSNTVAEGEAIWVRAFTPGVQLRLHDTPACTTTRARLGPGEWYQRLSVSADGLRDGFSGNVLGQLRASEDGFDARDLSDLAPPFRPFLSLTFPRPGWGERAGIYNTDFRALGHQTQEWAFEVRSDRPRTITLAWDDPHQQLQRATLVDLDGGAEIRPQPGESYTVVMGSATHRFLWRVASDGGAIHQGGFE